MDMNDQNLQEMAQLEEQQDLLRAQNEYEKAVDKFLTAISQVVSNAQENAREIERATSHILEMVDKLKTA